MIFKCRKISDFKKRTNNYFINEKNIDEKGMSLSILFERNTAYNKNLRIPYLIERENIIKYFHILPNHYESKIMVRKIIEAGYYWKSISSSVNDVISTCNCKNILISRSIHFILKNI